MNSSEFHRQFQIISQKVSLLLEERNLLRTYSEQKDQEIQSLKVQIESFKAELSDFKNHDKISKIVSGISDINRDNEEVKAKLTEYIRVIDRCIKLLNE